MGGELTFRIHYTVIPVHEYHPFCAMYITSFTIIARLICNVI